MGINELGSTSLTGPDLLKSQQLGPQNTAKNEAEQGGVSPFHDLQVTSAAHTSDIDSVGQAFSRPHNHSSIQR